MVRPERLSGRFLRFLLPATMPPSASTMPAPASHADDDISRVDGHDISVYLLADARHVAHGWRYA